MGKRRPPEQRRRTDDASEADDVKRRLRRERNKEAAARLVNSLGLVAEVKVNSLLLSPPPPLIEMSKAEGRPDQPAAGRSHGVRGDEGRHGEGDRDAQGTGKQAFSSHVMDIKSHFRFQKDDLEFALQSHVKVCDLSPPSPEPEPPPRRPSVRVVPY
jgi:hypothetical protein